MNGDHIYPSGGDEQFKANFLGTNENNSKNCLLRIKYSTLYLSMKYQNIFCLTLIILKLRLSSLSIINNQYESYCY